MLSTVAVGGLLTMFSIQQVDIAHEVLGIRKESASIFFINKFIRFLVNDAFAVLLIFALFRQRKYVIFALWVQVAGFFLLLIPYLILKFYYPTYNGPLINFLHRLILNPTLLLLLIPAFYYQQIQNNILKP
jgi:exosortase F-associated protein